LKEELKGLTKNEIEKLILKEVEEVAALISKLYPHKNEFLCEIIERLIHEKIELIKVDIYQLDFKELYKKHLKGLLIFSREDFTKKELEAIIEEAYLNERDKAIAKLYYLEEMKHEEIADRLGVDRKTITRNMPRLKEILKKQALKFIA
jgi:RNA polymerase sigma factor (sigma-70 family)